MNVIVISEIFQIFECNMNITMHISYFDQLMQVIKIMHLLLLHYQRVSFVSGLFGNSRQ